MTENKEVGLFAGTTIVQNPKLKEKLREINENLMSGGIAMPRISLRGGKFRQMIAGEQQGVTNNNEMNVIIVRAAKVSRTYYKGVYDPDKAVPPTCWSSDTQQPAADVSAENKQADRCMDCPMNVKGSGQNNTKACRYNQRLAIVPEDNMERVYQLQLPATSIFGDVVANKMPMQSYAKFLEAHDKTPIIAIVTQMYFDDDADVPKLFFTPVRPLNEGELEKAIELSESPEAERAVSITVSQADGVMQPEEEPKDDGDDTNNDSNVDNSNTNGSKPDTEGASGDTADAVAANSGDGTDPDEPPEPVVMKSSKKTADEPEGDVDEDLVELIDKWTD